MHFIIYLLTFLYVLGPITNVFGLGPYEDLSFLTSLVVVAYAFLRGKLVRIDKEVFVLIAMVISIAIFIWFAGVISGFEHGLPVEMLFRSFRLVIVIFTAYVLAQIIIDLYSDRSTQMIEMIIFSIITFHALLMVIMMLFPGVKDAVYSVTNAGSDNILEINREARIAGLAGAGGAPLSVFQSFGVLIGLHIFGQSRGIGRIIITFAILLCFVSTVLSARTGMYVSIIALMFYPLITSKVPLKVYCYMIIIWGLIGFLLMPFLFYFYDENMSFRWLIDRNFRTLVDWYETGILHDLTVVELSRQAVMTNDVLVYIIGLGSDEGYYGRYFQTDVGYLKYLAAFGVLGSLIALLPYVYISIKSYKSSLLITLVFISLVVHSKEIFLFSRMSFDSVIILFFVFVLTQKLEKIVNQKTSVVRSL